MTQPFFDLVRLAGPRLAVVLGSGLGEVPNGLIERASIAFAEVPGLGSPSVHGHSGRIVLGEISGKPIVVYRGRLHYYEGKTWDQVAGPIRLAAEMGIKYLLLTNAAGGIREDLVPGELMALRSHLFLQVRANLQEPPLASPYSPELLARLKSIDPQLSSGTYAAVTGPCYETPAEIRAFRAMGADAVGMSTAFEAQTASDLGINVAAISCITNKAAGLSDGPLNHAEVLANASKPVDRLSAIVAALAEAL